VLRRYCDIALGGLGLKILRANMNDTDIFSERELDFGACCYYSEDRSFRYFFEINGREATLFTNTDQYISETIEEFLFYSGFIVSIKDEHGHVLAERTQSRPYLLEILKIQPSQFYISEKKLESCKKWIKTYEEIFIPIVIKDDKVISLDGHTRLRAALDLEYTSVLVYPDEYDDYIFSFADEAIKRKIFKVSDMEIVSDEEYTLKWHKYCDEFFACAAASQ
jgi:hypothetical protein